MSKGQETRQAILSRAFELAQEIHMLIILAIILGIAWLLGFTVFHVASGAIHLLLILAVVGVIAHLLRGRTMGGTPGALPR